MTIAKCISRILDDLENHLFFLSFVYGYNNGLFFTVVLIVTLFKFELRKSLQRKFINTKYSSEVLGLEFWYFLSVIFFFLNKT